VNGVVYFGEGGWGAPLYAADNPKSWTRGYESVNHFMVVHFYPNKVDIYTIRLENEPNVPALTDQTRMNVPTQLSLETMTDKNGVQSGDHVTISKSVTALPDQPDNSISVFPSSVQDYLTIKNDNLADGASVKIVDITGKTLKDVSMNSLNLLQLNMTGYRPGVYVVQVSNVSSLKVFKIIKQ